MQELTGHKFGRLTVLKFHEKGPRGNHRWLCQCECGKTKSVRGYNLIHGQVLSCRCLNHDRIRESQGTHLKSRTSEFNIWVLMRQRCANPKNKCFYRYGGRGIKVCDHWQNSFENFYADMGPRPSLNHSIDRIDNDGNYDPSNCRWATREVQARDHGAKEKTFTANGVTKTLRQWAKEIGIHPARIGLRQRMYGWTLEQALTTPKWIGVKRH